MPGQVVLNWEQICPREHLATAENTFGRHNGEVLLTSCGERARPAAERPTMHGTALHTKNCPAPHVNSAKVEKPCPA